MKKKSFTKIIAVLFALVCFLLFLNRLRYKSFSENDENLHESMKLYYSLGTEPVKGRFFEARLLNAFQTVTQHAKTQSEVSHYFYTIAFAPLIDKPYKLTRIEIEPIDEAIQNYLLKLCPPENTFDSAGTYSIAPYFYDDVIPGLPFSNEFDFYPQKHDEFQAYVLQVSFNDLGADHLQDEDLSQHDFAQGIRKIRLILHYGLWKKDELVICFDGEWDTGQTGEPYRFSLAPLHLYENAERGN